MIGRAFDDISIADLNGLIAGAVRESRTIEYKAALPGGADSEKKEFLADVSSFANGAGGDLLYGVEAISGVPTRLCGLPGIDSDKEYLRLESILRDGLDPRIPGLRIKTIDVPGTDGVLLIRAPKSWAGPHMVVFKDSSRFFSRSSAGKFQLDTDELRSAFALAADLPARIRSWRDERLGKIATDDTPVPIAGSAKMVLHLVPLESFRDAQRIPAAALSGKTLDFRPMYMSSWNHRINLDGFVTYGGRSNSDPKASELSYCQVFRSGQIEAVYADAASAREGSRLIASQWYELVLLESTARYLRALAVVGVQPPLVVMVSFVGVRGATLTTTVESWFEAHPIDRDVLVLPDVLIEEAPKDLPREMRPIFDALWNACGAPQSRNFNAAGKWVGGQLQDVPMELPP